jgi:hypothetical protein
LELSLVLDFVFFKKIFIFFSFLISKNMPRRSTIYHREPKEWFSCPVHDCSRKFKTQTGRTKHIRSKHKKPENDLQTRRLTRTRSPLASVSSIDSDADINMPCTPPHHGVQLGVEVASDIGFDSDGTNLNMTRSPIHLPIGNDNDPSSPQAPPFQPEVDQVDQAFASRATNYHPFINGMT